jgi:hypothetical protein
MGRSARPGYENKMKHLLLVLVGVLSASSAWACACGCGVFDVGTSTMIPNSQGGMAFFEYDFMDQTKNWAGSSQAAAAGNDDKEIRSNFLTAGMEYMFNRSWGAEIEIPYTFRYFKTLDDDTNNIGTFNHGALGDIRISGIYTGFSPDMSTGITFGLKLPTGDWQFPGFDRDVQIGTGSINTLIGAFHLGKITEDNLWDWYAQGLWDQAIITQGDYRPGSEVDAALGGYYNGLSIGSTKLVPIAQLLGSFRLKDTGVNADPTGSGYERFLVSPGLEADFSDFRIYGDAELQVYAHVNGNQLVAPVIYKFIASYSF